MKNYEAFCRDYVDEIYKHYDESGFKYDKTERDLTNVLSGYISIFVNKFVVDWPRTIKPSKEVQAKISENQKLRDDVNYMLNRIRDGENINGHLTRKIYRTASADKLFADWGITHIHLNQKEADTYEEMRNNREGDLLFCVFTKDVCYVIDVLPHDPCPFSLMSHLRIIVNNWPGLILSEAKDFKCVYPIRTDKEVMEYRDSNANALVYEIDGKQYFKNQFKGLTKSGNSLESRQLATHMVRELEKIEDEYESLKFKFLWNDFGDIKCKGGIYTLGQVYRK